ncbi:MAG TPA: porin [Terriglobia bacterium]|nr:porin [Terriglobia bacterium]
MKKTLMATTALLGAGAFTTAASSTPAVAADGIKLYLGGFFQTAVLYNIDDHKQGDLGHNRYADGVFSDAEIYFLGKTTLDNGLTVGTRVELEGEQSNDQIDAAYVYFQGGFGEVRIGSQLGALEAMCVTPVGGTANFGAFSQDQVINNAFGGFSAGICEGVDSYLGNEHSQKIVYISPDFGGFQLGVSWAPNGGHESSEVTGFHSGMPNSADFEQRNVIDVYGAYNHDFSNWSLAWVPAAAGRYRKPAPTAAAPRVPSIRRQ